jgi:hypothetical protein
MTHALTWRTAVHSATHRENRVEEVSGCQEGVPASQEATPHHEIAEHGQRLVLRCVEVMPWQAQQAWQEVGLCELKMRWTTPAARNRSML